MSSKYVFDRAPRRVYWETTRACDLACRHCRAEAMPHRDPTELTTSEGLTLLDRLAEFPPGPPHVIFTGGDPLKRHDLFLLIAHASSRGLGVSVAPSATPLLTRDAIGKLKRAGVEAISLSIDGATAAHHDGIRGVEGCFDRTLLAAAAAREDELPFQVNTLVSRETLDDLPAIHPLVAELGAARWSLFFLIAVGRGSVLEPITPDVCTRLFDWLADLGGGGPIVTTTEAPQFRRVLLERGSRGVHGALHGAGIRDGNGIMFISHTGTVTPSGFLPLAAGNVKVTTPVEIYQKTPIFQMLRRPDSLRGRCGACDFRAVCGGSRARAFVAHGDPLAEDPLCALPVEATVG